jgi:hypothetical protein
MRVRKACKVVSFLVLGFIEVILLDVRVIRLMDRR